MEALDSLNPEQRGAVLHTEGPLLILAGAGSGKTRVIAHRIAYLIRSGKASPGQILAVTFTNKAAGEMRARVSGLVGADCPAAWISTFHSLCARLLRREAPAVGLSRDFVIYDSADQLGVVKRALQAMRLDDRIVQPRAVLSAISHAKNRMESAADMAARAWSYREEQIAKVFTAYETALSEASALDFDDLLLRTVQLFAQQAVRERYASRFRYVMVDEYQDTNRPQYELTRHLAAHRNLAVVGDPDQSIYKWRGADLRNLLDFETDFPDAVIVRLERNYRSTQVILDAASAVIACNTRRHEKRLWTERLGGARIVHHHAPDELAEADFITWQIGQALREDASALVGVLYRMNSQSRAIEESLMRERLPYRVVGGVRFYERKEVKDALAYLRLLVNPDDDVSFLRIVNTPPRGIGKQVLSALEAARARPVGAASSLFEAPGGRSLWSAALHLLQERALPGRPAAALERFIVMMEQIRVAAAQGTISEIVGKTLAISGYLDHLRDADSEEAESRLANLMEFVSAARERELNEPELSLRAFIDQLALLSETDEGSGPETSQVWLMTMHAAKGLEFPVVIVAGVVEGVFPHVHADEPEELEEERRLCYVAMTRAQHALVVTSTERRRVFGEYQATSPSRFLAEIPADLIEPAIYAPPGRRWAPGRPGSARRPSRVREAVEPYAYEDEDQSAGAGVRKGVRVRHAQFGLGTVVDVEPLDNDTTLTIDFVRVGTKKIRARFAHLEPA